MQSPGSSAAVYQEALAKARRGETDQQVLEVFYSAYEEAKRGYDRQLVSERATNLAALLVDMANKIGDAGLRVSPARARARSRALARTAPAVPRPCCEKKDHHLTAPMTWRARHVDGHVPGGGEAVRGGSEGAPRR